MARLSGDRDGFYSCLEQVVLGPHGDAWCVTAGQSVEEERDSDGRRFLNDPDLPNLPTWSSGRDAPFSAEEVSDRSAKWLLQTLAGRDDVRRVSPGLAAAEAAILAGGALDRGRRRPFDWLGECVSELAENESAGVIVEVAEHKLRGLLHSAESALAALRRGLCGPSNAVVVLEQVAETAWFRPEPARVGSRRPPDHAVPPSGARWAVAWRRERVFLVTPRGPPVSPRDREYYLQLTPPLSGAAHRTDLAVESEVVRRSHRRRVWDTESALADRRRLLFDATLPDRCASLLEPAGRVRVDTSESPPPVSGGGPYAPARRLWDQRSVARRLWDDPQLLRGYLLHSPWRLPDGVLPVDSHLDGGWPLEQPDGVHREGQATVWRTAEAPPPGHAADAGVRSVWMLLGLHLPDDVARLCLEHAVPTHVPPRCSEQQRKERLAEATSCLLGEPLRGFFVVADCHDPSGPLDSRGVREEVFENTFSSCVGSRSPLPNEGAARQDTQPESWGRWAQRIGFGTDDPEGGVSVHRRGHDDDMCALFSRWRLPDLYFDCSRRQPAAVCLPDGHTRRCGEKEHKQDRAYCCLRAVATELAACSAAADRARPSEDDYSAV